MLKSGKVSQIDSISKKKAMPAMEGNLAFNHIERNKRILAVTTGGLGDAVLFSPVLNALKTISSQTHIEMLVTNPLVLEVYQSVKEISHISFVRSNKSSLLFKAFFMLPIALKYLVKGGFDIGLFATGLNPRLGLLFKFVGGVRNIYFAPSHPDFKSDLECNIALAHRFNQNICKNGSFVPLTDSSMLEAKMISEQCGLSWDDKKIVAIYPSKELKHRPRWKLENLLRLIELFKSKGFKGKFVVVGSAREGKEWDGIDSDGITDANLAGKLSILGSASFIKKCALVIGNDGGLMHMAGAVGCPLVVVMTNTPISYRPPGENTIVIHSKLDCCNGIYPNRPKDCSSGKCAEAIKVKEVYEACLERLSKLPN